MNVIIRSLEEFSDSEDTIDVEGSCEILVSHAPSTAAINRNELDLEVILGFEKKTAEIALQAGGRWVSKNVLNAGSLLKLETDSQQHFLLRFTGVQRILIKAPFGFYAWLNWDKQPYKTPKMTFTL